MLSCIRLMFDWEDSSVWEFLQTKQWLHYISSTMNTSLNVHFFFLLFIFYLFIYLFIYFLFFIIIIIIIIIIKSPPNVFLFYHPSTFSSNKIVWYLNYIDATGDVLMMMLMNTDSDDDAFFCATCRQQRLQFLPPMEEIRMKYYGQLKRFLAIPHHFKVKFVCLYILFSSIIFFFTYGRRDAHSISLLDVRPLAAQYLLTSFIYLSTYLAYIPVRRR